MKPLSLSFFRRPAEVVALDLLGATIVSGVGRSRVSGVIVETEAYLGFDDPASHAYRGRRHAGNSGVYSPPGTWYVYRSYGVHWCANLVVGGGPAGSAVLLRAIRPLEGLPVIRRRRGAVSDRELANGPGKLCQALRITGEFDGTPMRDSNVVVGRMLKRPVGVTVVTPRIGITKAVDWPLRFLVPAPPYPFLGAAEREPKSTHQGMAGAPEEVSSAGRGAELILPEGRQAPDPELRPRHE